MSRDQHHILVLNILLVFFFYTKGSMMGPHWNPMATEIAIVLQGEGMVRVVCPGSAKETDCKNLRFRVGEGDVFAVPRFHPMAQISFNNDSLVFMGFSTSVRPNYPQFLAGKRSVLRALDRQILSVSFNVSNTTVSQLLAQQAESIILDCTSCAEEEERIMQDEIRREKEEEEAREREEERRREEEEARRREEEEEARRREEEEARRKEEERERETREQEERERQEEEQRRQEEEEEARRQEEERQRRQHEEEERERKEREQEEERRQEEEQRRQEEEEAQREQEEARRQEEERQQREKEERESEERREQEERESEERREQEERERQEEQRRQEEEERQWEEEEGGGGHGGEVMNLQKKSGNGKRILLTNVLKL